jgi:transposase-like protein
MTLTGGDGWLLALVIVFSSTAVIFAARWLVASRLRCPSCGHSHIALRMRGTGVPRFYCRRCRFEW